MTNLVIHPEVGDDIAEAVNWYKGIDPELAERLTDVVYGSIESAKESPWHHPKIYLGYRRVLCEPFPYKVIFEVLEDRQAVHVVSVFHHSKDPDLWKKRI